MSLRGDIHLHQDDENNALFPFKLLPTYIWRVQLQVNKQ